MWMTAIIANTNLASNTKFFPEIAFDISNLCSSVQRYFFVREFLAYIGKFSIGVDTFYIYTLFTISINYEAECEVIKLLWKLKNNLTMKNGFYNENPHFLISEICFCKQTFALLWRHTTACGRTSARNVALVQVGAKRLFVQVAHGQRDVGPERDVVAVDLDDAPQVDNVRSVYAHK